MLSRQHLIQMKEESLTKDVLMPLFCEMGFRDVEYRHGSQEDGRDIVMWRPDDFHGRVNYAVLAKAGDITGGVTGVRSAAAVTTQVEQCFHIHDAAGLRIHQCFVVTSGRISAGARKKVLSLLEAKNLAHTTKLIDGNELWQLCTKCLPQSVFEHIRQLRDKLNLNEYWRLTPTVRGDRTDFVLEAKRPDAFEKMPVRFDLMCQFPDSAEGKRKIQEFEDLWAKGTPVTLGREHIKQLDMPDFLKPFLGAGEMSIPWEIRAQQVASAARPVPVRIIATPSVGRPVEFEYVELRLVRAGNKEALLSNEDQPVAWKFRLLIDRASRSARLTYNVGINGTNALTALRALRFQQVVAEGCTISIILYESGKTISTVELEPDDALRPEGAFVRLAEQLAYIQERTGVLISIPDRDISVEEIRQIYRIALIVEKGVLEYGWTEIKFEIDRNTACKILEEFRRHGTMEMTFSPPEEYATICDVQIPLGQPRLVCQNATITQEEQFDIEACISSADPNGDVPVRIVPSDQRPIQAEYPKWLSESDSP